MSEENQSKQINIIGINNRYMIKKVDKQEKNNIIRKECLNWNIDQKYYLFNEQLDLLPRLINKQIDDNSNSIFKLIHQQINNKLNSYRNQDLKKNLYNSQLFIKKENVLLKLLNEKMLCYYCRKQMLIIYDKSRENRQWTIDRIDNDKGHNCDNYHLSCFECNIKRRRQSDEKFLFTKQLTIIKS
jgi:hypothetical protein